MTDPRLFPDDPEDDQVLRAELEARTLDEVLATSHEIIDEATAEHHPLATLCLFSGGNDSTTLLHVVKDRIDLVVHVNTGIGISETRQFVRDTCALWGLPLHEGHPPPGATYRELVLKHGFPGPGGHMMMYTRLKERALREVRKSFVKNGRRERVMFLAGMRLLESKRRWRNAEKSHREGAVVWASPLIYWTNNHMREYRERYQIPHNEVSDHLHMSGECLCGAFAKPGELDLIRFFYPDTAAEIEALEAEVRAAGIPACKWGQRPPRKLKKKETLPPGPLCNSCTLFDQEPVPAT